jgi:hypothetical protein
MVGVAVPGEGIRRFRRASELTRERQAGAAGKTRREKGISSQAKKKQLALQSWKAPADSMHA